MVLKNSECLAINVGICKEINFYVIGPTPWESVLIYGFGFIIILYYKSINYLF